MLTMRAMAAVAIFTGAIIAAMPAAAQCNQNYTWTCTPVPYKDPPEPGAESEKTSKPLQINSRRPAARKAARAERSAQTQRKRFGKRSGPERTLSVRQRRAKAVAARARARVRPPIVAEDDLEESPPLPPVRRFAEPRRMLTSADPGASTGEATDLNAATDVLQPQSVTTVPVAGSLASPAEPARPDPAAGPAPIPVRTVSQSEVNEIDLAVAAGPESADQSWMRTLVLAFGGVLAVGSALRLLL